MSERKQALWLWQGLVAVMVWWGSVSLCQARANDWGVGFAIGAGYTVQAGTVLELPTLELRYYTNNQAFMDIQLAAPLILSRGGRLTAPFQVGWSFNGQIGSEHVHFFAGVGLAFTLWSTPVTPLPLLQFLFPLRLGLHILNRDRTLGFQLRVSPAFVVQAFAVDRNTPSYQPFPTFQVLGEMALLFYLSRQAGL